MYYYVMSAYGAYDTGINFLSMVNQTNCHATIKRFIDDTIRVFEQKNNEKTRIVFQSNYKEKDHGVILERHTPEDLIGTFRLETLSETAGASASSEGSINDHVGIGAEQSRVHLFSDGICVIEFDNYSMKGMFQQHGCDPESYACDILQNHEVFARCVQRYRYDPARNELITSYDCGYSDIIDERNILYQFFKYIYNRFDDYLAEGRPDKYSVLPEEQREKFDEFISSGGNECFSKKVLYTEDFFFKLYDENGKEKYLHPASVISDMIDGLLPRYFDSVASDLFPGKGQMGMFKELLSFLRMFLKENEYKSVEESFGEVMELFQMKGLKFLHDINLQFFYDRYLTQFAHEVIRDVKRLQYAMYLAREKMERRAKRLRIRKNSVEVASGMWNSMVTSVIEYVGETKGRSGLFEKACALMIPDPSWSGLFKLNERCEELRKTAVQEDVEPGAGEKAIDILMEKLRLQMFACDGMEAMENMRENSKANHFLIGLREIMYPKPIHEVKQDDWCLSRQKIEVSDTAERKLCYNRLEDILFSTLSDLGTEKERILKCGIVEAVHYRALCKCVDDNFTVDPFALSEINACHNKITEVGNRLTRIEKKYQDEVTGLGCGLPFDLRGCVEHTLEQIELKKELRLDSLRKNQNRQQLIFNILIGVFSAFGIASSIVSIIATDELGRAVSALSILMYLAIVIVGYVQNYCKSN